MMRSPQHRDAMADGISIRVRVRRAQCTSKLDYGEQHDMVCTIVNWDSSTTVGATRRKPGSPRRPNLANQFRSSSSSKADPSPNGTLTPTLFFQTRTYSGPTLEACCSLHSVSSYDSMDPSIVSETVENDPNPVGSMMTASQRISINEGKRKKTYSVPCSCIKSVEKISSLFRGYRIFFATSSRGSYELEFENKNGMDIMIAFLQATLPAERFVNLANNSVDGEDSASNMSSLDVEKLTERLAERQSAETMSEKLRKGVGQMVSSIEEMSNSFCGNVCCSGQFMGASVAPYVPTDEIRDSPPKGSSKTTFLLDNFPEPVMEIDEEKSTQGSEIVNSEELNKRMYLKDYKLPSGLSMEMPE